MSSADYSLLLATIMDNDSFFSNPTTGVSLPGLPRAMKYPLSYRIIGTLLQVIIFVIGFFGNIMICVVVQKTKALHTTTYCYLVSLAVADILLVCCTIPESILSYQLYGKQWVLGHVGCSLTVFTSFLAINAGSISILAFTVERYIAICHPILAQKVCTVSRARRIIALTWLFVGIYCTPWLALTSTKPLRLAYQPEMEKCDYTLSRDQYLPLFLIDVIIFYVLPLLISVVLYTRMGFTLHQSVQALRHTHKGSTASPSTCSSPNWAGSTAKSKAKYCVPQRDSTDSIESTRLHGGTAFSNGSNCITSKRTENLQTSVMKSRCQVVKMLIIVVACFAVLWLPYRGLLVYNSVVAKPWQEMWYVDQSLNNRSNVSLGLIIYPFLLTSRYMLFAKTAVYLNSAINPFLYTVLSRKFRTAFFSIICGCCQRKNAPQMTYSVTNMSLRTASGAGMLTNVLPFQSFAMEKTRQHRSNNPQTPNSYE